MKCKQCVFRSVAAHTLDSRELEYLSVNCAEVRMKAGEIVIKEGSLSSHIAYLKDGLVKIHKGSSREGDHLLKLAGNGSYIGIQTILADRIHQYSATCLSEVRICFIDIRSFRELLKRNHEFSYEVILYLCRDELNYFDRVTALSNRQVHGRLAHALLYMSAMVGSSGDKSFRMPITRKELASMINASRESVSRALQEMVRSGMIWLDGRNIRILSEKLLHKISESG